MGSPGISQTSPRPPSRDPALPGRGFYKPCKLSPCSYLWIPFSKHSPLCTKLTLGASNCPLAARRRSPARRRGRQVPRGGSIPCQPAKPGRARPTPLTLQLALTARSTPLGARGFGGCHSCLSLHKPSWTGRDPRHKKNQPPWSRKSGD